MSTVERIQEIIDCSNSVPERDEAGIITAAGIDSLVRLKTLNECLKIANEEEQKINERN